MNEIKGTLEVLDDFKLYDYLIQIYCVLENKTLPVSERWLLGYYIKYGVTRDTDKLYAKDFNRDKQIVSNLKCSLTKRGFLIKNEDLNDWKIIDWLKNKFDNQFSLILKFIVK